MAVHVNLAGVRFQQADNQLQDRRFARARCPQEDLGMAGQQFEAHVTQDDLVVERQLHVLENDDGTVGPVGRRRRRRGFHEQGHQYSSSIRSGVMKKSTAITATDPMTTALVVARPTPWVPPLVRRPTTHPMLTMTKPR